MHRPSVTFRCALIVGLAAVIGLAGHSAEGAARKGKKVVSVRGTGVQPKGLKGAAAKKSAALAAAVHALGRWAHAVHGAQMDWVRDPRVDSYVFRQHLNTRLPGGLKLTTDSWVKNRVMVHSVLRVDVPAAKIRGRLPVSFVVVNGVLVSPSPDLVEAGEFQGALEGSGFSYSKKSSRDGSVEVTLSRALPK